MFSSNKPMKMSSKRDPDGYTPRDESRSKDTKRQEKQREQARKQKRDWA